jgi:hypothetical protein
MLATTVVIEKDRRFSPSEKVDLFHPLGFLYINETPGVFSAPPPDARVDWHGKLTTSSVVPEPSQISISHES